MQKMPVAAGRVAMVVELEIDKNRPAAWARTTVSLPGREGTSSRVWELHHGQPDHLQAEDITVMVARALMDAMALAVGGVQMALSDLTPPTVVRKWAARVSDE